MKRIFLTVALAMGSLAGYSQTDDKGYEEGKWVLKGITGINMSQTAVSNWSAGGENSFAGQALQQVFLKNYFSLYKRQIRNLCFVQYFICARRRKTDRLG